MDPQVGPQERREGQAEDQARRRAPSRQRPGQAVRPKDQESDHQAGKEDRERVAVVEGREDLRPEGDTGQAEVPCAPSTMNRYTAQTMSGNRTACWYVNWPRWSMRFGWNAKSAPAMRLGTTWPVTV